MTKQNLGGSFAYHKNSTIHGNTLLKRYKFTELKFAKLLRICQLKYQVQWKYEERKSQFY